MKGFVNRIILFIVHWCFFSLSCTRAYRPRHVPFRDAKKYSRNTIDSPLMHTKDRELIHRCEKRYIDVRLDHFSWSNLSTFPLRYYICNEYWKNTKHEGSMFVYLGNEADVTLYLNHSGLMWESAPEHNAMLVFIEHRYYGESKPFDVGHIRQHMGYLTTEQAMADFAYVIDGLKVEFGDAPVITFGGSYGGMLCVFFREKYPHLVDGTIAASAPIWAYQGLGDVDSYGFAKVVTRDASPKGGSSKECIPHARQAWKILFDLGKSEEGRARIAKSMRLCSQPNDEIEVQALADWASEAWDMLAMGNYPYPSGYILDGQGILPAFPVRVACQHLDNGGVPLEGDALLSRMADAIGVFYNFSQALTCYDPEIGPSSNASKETEDFWSYQYCTEHFMPFSKDGVHDMFWDQPFNVTEAVEECKNNWGVVPDVRKSVIEWGGRNILTHTNIVFSNGLLDPWSATGVLDPPNTETTVIILSQGAHHTDLMFSNPQDPPELTKCRRIENEMIKLWISYKKRKITADTKQTALLSVV